MYLDLGTYYAQIPAGSLAFGFGSPSLFNAVQNLAGAERWGFVGPIARSKIAQRGPTIYG